MALFKARVPAALASGLVCLLLGAGAGALTMYAAVGKADPQADAAPAEEGSNASSRTNPKAGGTKGGGAKGGGGGDKKGGGQRGPSPKAQLAQLVGKLDVLTAQSLHVELTTDQKKQAKELLADLTEKDAITDEEAKAKLDALLALLEPNKQTLEDAGFRWPGAGGGGGPGGGGQTPSTNPFKTGEAADRLKALQTALGK
jgi:hypothetical protein